MKRRGEHLELEAKRKKLTELAIKFGTSHQTVQELNREVEELMLSLQRKISSISRVLT